MTPLSLDGRPGDMLFAVLGVQLGYLAADDALAAARELTLPGEQRSLSELLVARGVLDRARAQVLERLAARATSSTGGDASETLRLLPSDLRELAATTREMEGVSRASGPVGPGLVDEQPHRYFAAPRADAPPKLLGQGEFATVVLRHDTVLGRDVAWKQAREATPEAWAQLAAEARQAARLDHPAAVPVYELGRGGDGAPYVTMRRVAGRTLAQALTVARGVDERLSLLPAFHTVCRCVAVAHEQKVSHRSLSCASVMLGEFGEVYLLGWGPPADDARAAEADVKALGAMLHELATGLPPPVMGQVRARGVPADLLTLVREALAGRVPSAEQLARDVKAFIDGRRVGSHHYSSLELVRRSLSRNRAFWAVAVLSLALLVAAASFFTARVGEERDRARLFARRFLDDIALRLHAQPGVEPLLDQVTQAALRHYQRTGELNRLPAEERMRVAHAMARLGGASVSLGRTAEADASLAFALSLAEELLRRDPREPEAHLVVAQVELSRAGAAGPERAVHARRAAAAADEALALRADSGEARALAARARVAQAATVSDVAAAAALFDDAVKALEGAGAELQGEVLEARGEVLLARLERLWSRLDGAHRLADSARLEAVFAELRRRQPDDPSLKLRSAGALVLRARALELSGPDDSRRAAEEALGLAREALEHRPDLPGAAAAVVESQLLAGRPAEAWVDARRFEARGQGDVGPWLAEAAFFAGDFQQARALAGRETVAGQPSQMLLRALASALLERPGDAVIQARALRGALDATGWPAERLARFLAARPPGDGAGDRSVRAFSEAWLAGDASAVEAWVQALEAQLAGR